MGGSGRKNKDKKRKDPQFSPEQGSSQETKRATMAANGGNSTPQGTQQASQQAIFSPPNYGYTPQFYNLPNAPLFNSPVPNLPMQNNHAQNAVSTQEALMGKILDRLEQMDKKLTQLDAIQVSVTAIQAHVGKLDERMITMENRMHEFERSRSYDSETTDTIQKRQIEIENLLERMQNTQQEKEIRDSEIQAEMVDLKCRSMRDNLVFYNIEEEKDEDCVSKILEFVEENLKVPNAKAEIKLHRAHRMGKYLATKTRPIVAKFVYYPDRESVRKAAGALKGTQFGISQQFPKEVQDKRRILVPIMKKAKEEGREAYIAIDKLYIDGHLYRPEPSLHANSNQTRFHPRNGPQYYNRDPRYSQSAKPTPTTNRFEALNRGSTNSSEDSTPESR